MLPLSVLVIVNEIIRAARSGSPGVFFHGAVTIGQAKQSVAVRTQGAFMGIIGIITKRFPERAYAGNYPGLISSPSYKAKMSARSGENLPPFGICVSIFKLQNLPGQNCDIRIKISPGSVIKRLRFHRIHMRIAGNHYRKPYRLARHGVP